MPKDDSKRKMVVKQIFKVTKCNRPGATEEEDEEIIDVTETTKSVHQETERKAKAKSP